MGGGVLTPASVREQPAQRLAISISSSSKNERKADRPDNTRRGFHDSCFRPNRIGCQVNNPVKSVQKFLFLREHLSRKLNARRMSDFSGRCRRIKLPSLG
jgi:hypothetical protein